MKRKSKKIHELILRHTDRVKISTRIEDYNKDSQSNDVQRVLQAYDDWGQMAKQNSLMMNSPYKGLSYLITAMGLYFQLLSSTANVMAFAQRLDIRSLGVLKNMIGGDYFDIADMVSFVFVYNKLSVMIMSAPFELSANLRNEIANMRKSVEIIREVFKKSPELHRMLEQTSELSASGSAYSSFAGVGYGHLPETPEYMSTRIWNRVHSNLKASAIINLSLLPIHMNLLLKPLYEKGGIQLSEAIQTNIARTGQIYSLVQSQRFGVLFAPIAVACQLAAYQMINQRRRKRDETMLTSAGYGVISVTDMLKKSPSLIWKNMGSIAAQSIYSSITGNFNYLHEVVSMQNVDRQDYMNHIRAYLDNEEIFEKFAISFTDLRNVWKEYEERGVYASDFHKVALDSSGVWDNLMLVGVTTFISSFAVEVGQIGYEALTSNLVKPAANMALKGLYSLYSAVYDVGKYDFENFWEIENVEETRMHLVDNIHDQLREAGIKDIAFPFFDIFTVKDNSGEYRLNPDWKGHSSQIIKQTKDDNMELLWQKGINHLKQIYGEELSELDDRFSTSPYHYERGIKAFQNIYPEKTTLENLEYNFPDFDFSNKSDIEIIDNFMGKENKVKNVTTDTWRPFGDVSSQAQDEYTQKKQDELKEIEALDRYNEQSRGLNKIGKIEL